MAVITASMLSCLTCSAFLAVLAQVAAETGTARHFAGQALAAAWLFGALCKGARGARQYIRFARAVRRCPKYFGRDAAKIAEQAGASCGGRKEFPILLAPGLAAPAVFGLLRPKILMPHAHYGTRELSLLLRHELLHYHSGHMLAKAFLEALCTVFWWNPAAYLLKGLAEEAMERQVIARLAAELEKEGERYAPGRLAGEKRTAGRARCVLPSAARRRKALRPSRQGFWGHAAPFFMAASLAAGVGTLTLARISYRDASGELAVEGRAWDYSSEEAAKLEKSELAEDFYCYGGFDARVEGIEESVPLTVTNDIRRCLAGSGKIRYAEGYGSSQLEKGGMACLVGEGLAQRLGIGPGGDVRLSSMRHYEALRKIYEGRDGLAEAVFRMTREYKAIGIVESEDESVQNGIFTGSVEAAQGVYGQPFPISYSSFTLADNQRLGELRAFLEEGKKSGRTYAPTASFQVDAAGLEHVLRKGSLLEVCFPAAVAAAAVIGLFGSGLLLAQSAQEAAFLLTAGARGLAFRQALSCAAGTALAACAIAWRSPGLFEKGAGPLAAGFAMCLICCVCGGAAASARIRA